MLEQKMDNDNIIYKRYTHILCKMGIADEINSFISHKRKYNLPLTEDEVKVILSLSYGEQNFDTIIDALKKLEYFEQ